MANVLVLGGSKGIGGALVRRLRAEGAQVTAVAREAEPLEALAAETGAQAVVGDALDPALVEEAVRTAGTVDGLAYCVGTIVLKPLTSFNREEWIGHFEKNLFGAVQAITKVVPGMKQAGRGSIVLFSTTASRIGLPNHALIGSAKGAVEGLARSLAADLAPSGIRVNVIAPGLTDTPLAAPVTSNERALEASIKMHPLSRIARADEVAELAAYFLGERSGFVTGQIVAVDGGLSSIKPRQA